MTQEDLLQHAAAWQYASVHAQRYADRTPVTGLEHPVAQQQAFLCQRVAEGYRAVAKALDMP